MSTFRYQSNPIDPSLLQEAVGTSLTVGVSNATIYVDIVLSDDSFKSDLDEAMFFLGYFPYAGSSPTGVAPPLTILSPSGLPWQLVMGNDGKLSEVSPTGVTGPLGVTGATGPQGVTGPQGATGPRGATGPTAPVSGSSSAAGVTSGPTTASATYVVVPEMTVSFVTGGTRPVFVLFQGSFNIRDGDNWFISIFVDGVQVAASEMNNHFFGGSLLGLTPAQINAGFAGCRALVTGLSAASHTFDVRWKVTAGSARAITTERQITAFEI